MVLWANNTDKLEIVSLFYDIFLHKTIWHDTRRKQHNTTWINAKLFSYFLDNNNMMSYSVKTTWYNTDKFEIVILFYDVFWRQKNLILILWKRHEITLKSRNYFQVVWRFPAQSISYDTRWKQHDTTWMNLKLFPSWMTFCSLKQFDVILQGRQHYTTKKHSKLFSCFMTNS